MNENSISAIINHHEPKTPADTTPINCLVINPDSGARNARLRLNIKHHDSLYMIDFNGNDGSRQKVQNNLSNWRLRVHLTGLESIFVAPSTIYILVDSTRVKFSPIRTIIGEKDGVFYFDSKFRDFDWKSSTTYQFRFEFDGNSMRSLIANLGDDQIEKEIRAVNIERNDHP